MLCARSRFQEIVDRDDSFQLFCSIAAGGKAQGGWENARIAALVPDTMLVKCFGDHPGVGKALHLIRHDEADHLAYCHEELLRLARAGHGRTIHRVLRESVLAEIAVYRDVSLAVMDHMGRLLHWPSVKAAAVAAGIRARYGYERFSG